MKYAFLILSSSLWLNISGYSLHNVSSLRKTLFQTNDYDVISRPMMDQSVPTIVHVFLLIYIIYDVDELMQTLKVSASLRLTWLDENLVWNPIDYGGIRTGVYPQNSVWKPDISLKNSVDDFKTLGDPSLNVIVTFEGLVTWEPYQIFTSRCRFDFTYFPFDKQTCEMIFVTWGYTASDVRIWRPELGQAQYLEDILNNPEWDLVGVKARNLTNPRPMIIFEVNLKRKPTHVVIYIITPLIVLNFLNAGVFLLPERSGEKTGYAVSVFLSFMVFETIVQATLPVNSENVCYLSIFVTLQTVERSVITIVAICLVRVEGRYELVSDWLASLIICVTCYKVSSRSSDPTKGGCNLCLGKQKCENNKVEPHFIDECHEHESSLGDNRKEVPIVDWGQVSSRLNWLFFAVFVVLNIASLFILMALLYLNTRDQ